MVLNILLYTVLSVGLSSLIARKNQRLPDDVVLVPMINIIIIAAEDTSTWSIPHTRVPVFWRCYNT